MYKAYQNLKLWGNILELLYLQGAEKITELRYEFETGKGMWSKVIWGEEYLFQQKISNGKVQQRVEQKKWRLGMSWSLRWSSMRSQGVQWCGVMFTFVYFHDFLSDLSPSLATLVTNELTPALPEVLS